MGIPTPSARTNRLLITTAVLAGLLTSSAHASAPSGAMNPEHQKVLQAVTPDPAPKNLVRSSHYVVSNEDRPYLFRPTIDEVGGALVGVGTDQLYMYASWARPDLIIPMDFDQVVVDLHRIYGLFFQVADTPDDFIAMWSPKQRKKSESLIESAATSPKDLKALGKAFKHGRVAVYARLRRLRRDYKKAKIPCFVTDGETYSYLSGLFRDNRVHMLRGDLTVPDGAMAGVGKALKEIGVPVSLIYLSNAEQYFEFTPAYRANFRALDFADNAQVLRTFPNGKEGDYTYMTQRPADFLEWLELPKIKKILQIRYHRVRQGARDRYVLPAPPEPKKDK